MTPHRHEAWPAAAAGLCAFALACVAHEGIGHGAGCLLSGGSITRMTTVVFRCLPASDASDAGGPLGSAVCAAIAGVRMRSGRGSPFAALVFAFAALWLGGYIVYSAALGRGDLAFVAASFDPPVRGVVRIVQALVGIAFYRWALVAMAPWLPARRVRVIASATAGVAVVASTLLHGIDAVVMRDALLESVVASAGMLVLPGRDVPFDTRLPAAVLAITGAALLAALGTGV